MQGFAAGQAAATKISSPHSEFSDMKRLAFVKTSRFGAGR
jgi:hypothetical protein